VRDDNTFRDHDGKLRLKQMRSFLDLFRAAAEDLFDAMDEIERLAALAEERHEPAALFVMPGGKKTSRKDLVQ
jgi:hypothetical protein